MDLRAAFMDQMKALDEGGHQRAHVDPAHDPGQAQGCRYRCPAQGHPAGPRRRNPRHAAGHGEVAARIGGTLPPGQPAGTGRQGGGRDRRDRELSPRPDGRRRHQPGGRRSRSPRPARPRSRIWAGDGGAEGEARGGARSRPCRPAGKAVARWAADGASRPHSWRSCGPARRWRAGRAKSAGSPGPGAIGRAAARSMAKRRPRSTSTRTISIASAAASHGDAISFVMQSQGAGFMEAVEQLAGEAGLEVPKPTPQQRPRRSAEASTCTRCWRPQAVFRRRLFAAGGRARRSPICAAAA